MEYWVDGYNLILRRGWDRTHTLEQGREKLIGLVVPLDTTVRLYFDAQGGAGSGSTDRSTRSSKVKTLFVTDGTADDAIVRDLAGRPRKDVTVVTDDRELRGRARQAGANTVGVDRFLQRLDRTQQPAPAQRKHPRSPRKDGEPRPDHVSKKDVDEWMRWFGFDKDEEPEP